jgi:hypothetical protein
MPRCPVRIRLWSGEPDGSFDCRLRAGHGGEHAANGLSRSQTIYFLDGDRRCFIGEFTTCDESRCVLPAGHHGGHAL